MVSRGGLRRGSRGIATAPVEVPLGHAGKPFLIPGTRDDADALMSRLIDRFGLGGVHDIRPIR